MESGGFNWAEFRKGRKTGESPSMLQCPRCRRSMTETRYGHLTLEECRSCGGAWFDKGGIEKALNEYSIERDKIAGDEVLNRVCRHTITNPRIQYLRCPRCAEMMARLNFEKVSGVIIDRCPSCGIWLDEGEFEKIHEFLSTGGKELRQRMEEVERDAEKRRGLYSKRQGELAPVAFSWEGAGLLLLLRTLL